MAADVPHEWCPGDVILDLYEVRDVIRSGGMGLVYRVLHRGWNVELAVKAPRPNLVATAGGLRDFEAEAATWAGLGEHPHSVNCVYVRRLGGVPRVFAEWVDGGSLAEAVRDGSLYSGGRREVLRRILDIAVQTAWGLQHAHQHGLVHQDVKPANVLLTRDGTAKVSDFGLAKARAVAGESSIVPPGASVLAGYGGMTPAYCSPEQAQAAAWTQRSGRPKTHLTRATDTWSWALTVLEMFVGHPPCQYGQTGAEVFAAFVAAGEQEGRVAMPEELVALLERCFAWSVAERPKDMGELAGQLIGIYSEALAEPYLRPQPRTAARLADELSNQALSMLDLGRTEETEALWRRAAEIDPRNPHVTYNRGLHLWRAGRLSDAQLIADLKALGAARPGDWLSRYLPALVHCERGDAESAEDELRAAAQEAPGNPEIAAAQERVERMPRPSPPVVLTGHTGDVRAVAISRDGRTGVSAAEDGTIRVWDLVGRRCMRVVAATDIRRGVSGLAIDAEAHRAVCHAAQGPDQVWDLRTGRLLRVLTHPGAENRFNHEGVAMSADGRLAMSAAAGEGIVRVWDVETGRCLHVMSQGPYGDGYSDPVALSADGQVALGLGRRDGAGVVPSPGAQVWDPGTGHVRHTIDGPFRTAALSADGRTAVTEDHAPGSRRGRMRVWDVASGRERYAVTRPAFGADCRYTISADGRYALCAETYTTELWELLPLPKCLRTWRKGFTSAAFSSDGRFILMGDRNGNVTLEELAPTGSAAVWSYVPPRSTTDRLRESALVGRALDRTKELTANGKFGAAAEEIRRARALPGYQRHHALLDRWQDIAKAGRRTTLSQAWLRLTLPHTGIDPTRLVPDGRTILRWSHEEHAITAWDLRNGRQLHSFIGDGWYDGHLALSGDGQVAMSSGRDGVRIWEVESGHCRHLFPDGSGPVAVDADGRIGVSSGREDGMALLIWDLVTGACLRELTGPTSVVYTEQLSADGRYALSTARSDKTLRLWDVRAGTCLHNISTARSNRVPSISDVRAGRVDKDDWTAFALSPAGNVLLTGHNDGTVRAWDVETGRCRQVMAGHESGVFGLRCSADGKIGVSQGRDGTMRIWDLGTGRCRHIVRNETQPPQPSPVISADDHFVVTGGAGDVVRVWDLSTGICLRSLEGHSAAISWLGISGNGHVVVSLDENEVVYVWELDWEYDFELPRGAAS